MLTKRIPKKSSYKQNINKNNDKKIKRKKIREEIQPSSLDLW